MTNSEIREQANLLQEILIQTCINFFKQHPNSDVEEIFFNMDAVQESVKEGMWVAATDSNLTLMKWVEPDLENYGREEIVSVG